MVTLLMERYVKFVQYNSLQIYCTLQGKTEIESYKSEENPVFVIVQGNTNHLMCFEYQNEGRNDNYIV